MQDDFHATYHLTLSLSSRRGENKTLIFKCLTHCYNRTQVNWSEALLWRGTDLAAVQAFGQIAVPIPQRKPTLGDSHVRTILIRIDQAAKFVGDSVKFRIRYSSRFIPGAKPITPLNLGA